MRTTQTLPPTTLRVLAMTAEAWGLSLCAPVPAIRVRVARLHAPRHAAYSTPSDLRQWPY